MKAILTTLCLLFLVTGAAAEQVYQTPSDFVDQAFAGAPPKPAVLWLNRERQTVIRQILGHPLRQLRLRYWARGGKSAWILQEIGKEHPITTGIVAEDGKIGQIRVLIYRESRGYEVRNAFFTDQFKGAGLDEQLRLDRPIDGISGATLSVRALTKLARLALYLDRQRQQ